MAADFWASSHYKKWIVDRATVHQARYEDLQYVEDPEYLDYLAIYFANLITKLGKKLQFRQRVIATATVFFRRFYLKNSYSETDPFTVIAACCYLAAKAEESPVHIKVIVSESRALFSQEHYGAKAFSSDNGKIAEMEFYLVDDLECDLVVFHPYRTLLALCKKEASATSSSASEEGEAEDLVGVGIDDGPRYWGTGDGQLEFPTTSLQTAWSIINDTYRSQLCLLHPPHLIAIAAIYLTFILHPQHGPSRPHHPNTKPRKPLMPPPANHGKHHDPIAFLADLNVSLPVVAVIAQEILAMYTMWDRYKEDMAPDVANRREHTHSPLPSGMAGRSPARRTLSSGSLRMGPGTPGADEAGNVDGGADGAGGNYITPAFLSAVLQRMRQARMMEMTPSASTPSTGRQVAVNKRLERTQAAG
ncbi:cyclin-like protein [Pholiota molesta]|nr:cyclin-like protein [Pholiota molesta]